MLCARACVDAAGARASFVASADHPMPACKLRFPGIPPENTVEFALGFTALQTQIRALTIVCAEVHKIAGARRGDESYMYRNPGYVEIPSSFKSWMLRYAQISCMSL